MAFFDLQVPFFRPLWRRILVTGVTLGWAVVEFATGATEWALLFGAAGLYCAYSFFVVFAPADPDDRDGTRPPR